MTKTEDKKLILKLIKESCQAGARKRIACEVMDIPIRTTQRWDKLIIDLREEIKKSPVNKLTTAERDQVLQICCSNRFVDSSVKVIVPILAEEGVYIASESTMYRILREDKLVNHREESKAPVHRVKPDELIATGPNQVWSWDITYLKTNIRGIFYYLYVFMDVWSRKIVGWDIYETQQGVYAKEIIENIKKEVDIRGIHLHSDNGSPMKGATFLSTLHWLGVIPSFSRPACSNDNPYSESLFKTIKYRVSYPKNFSAIDDAKEWTLKFVNWYNDEHRHSTIQYVTPSQRHEGLDKDLLRKRRETYKEAFNKHPERWIKNKFRQWNWEETEILNPDQSHNLKKEVA